MLQRVEHCHDIRVAVTPTTQTSNWEHLERNRSRHVLSTNFNVHKNVRLRRTRKYLASDFLPLYRSNDCRPNDSHDAPCTAYRWFHLATRLCLCAVKADSIRLHHTPDGPERDDRVALLLSPFGRQTGVDLPFQALTERIKPCEVSGRCLRPPFGAYRCSPSIEATSRRTPISSSASLKPVNPSTSPGLATRRFAMCIDDIVRNMTPRALAARVTA